MPEKMRAMVAVVAWIFRAVNLSGKKLVSKKLRPRQPAAGQMGRRAIWFPLADNYRHVISYAGITHDESFEGRLVILFFLSLTVSWILISIYNLEF
jgi:hypothetical protein